MTVVRSARDVLDDHVTLEVQCLDRMFLDVYQPRLQHVNVVVQFLRGHRGSTYASSPLLDPITKDFVGRLHRFCRDHEVPMSSSPSTSARTTWRTTTSNCSRLPAGKQEVPGSTPVTCWSG